MGEFEEEVREGFSRWSRNKFTGVFQGVSWKKRFFVRFQDECEKYMNSNLLNVVNVEKIPMKEKLKVPTVAVIPDETVPLYNGYYHGVHVLINFNKNNSAYRKYYHAGVEPDTHEEDMENVILDNEREHL